MTPTTWDRWGGAAGGWLGLLDKVERLLSPWLAGLFLWHLVDVGFGQISNVFVFLILGMD
jgi:hypothetical protein